MEIHKIHQTNLQLKWIAEFYGPNPWAESPALVCELMADSLPQMTGLSAAAENLWRLVGMDRPIDELACFSAQDDVLLLLGRVATHFAKAVLNEVRGFILHAGAERAEGVVQLWVGFHHAGLSRAVLQLALTGLVQLLNGQNELPSLRADLDQLWRACRRYHPDYQARILMVGAREMDVPYFHFLPDSRYWQFGWGTKARVLMESSSNQDGSLGQQWQKNKATGKALMTALGLPTPVHVLLSQEGEVPAAVERVGFPCVLKPLGAGGGKGVTANIRSLDDALTAFQVAFRQEQGPVMVEAHVPGDDHRLMVINGQFVAAIRREPSFVVGDGHKTLTQLVAELNAPRSNNMVRSRYLRPIALDEVLKQHLAAQQLRLTDVPASGQRVTLRSNANLSTGGICTDVTSICHPQIRTMAILLAKTTGLWTVGIDYMTKDISRRPDEVGGAFIEMNTTPGLCVCVAAGWSEAAIARLVLGESVGRISVDLTVLSPDGMARLHAGVHTIKSGAARALVVDNTLCYQDIVLPVGMFEPWAAVRASLRNPSIKHVQVFCTADTLSRYGCPVDRLRQVRVAVTAEQAVLSEVWQRVLNRHSQGTPELKAEGTILSEVLGGEPSSQAK
jgi:cyanophycin synthetase